MNKFRIGLGVSGGIAAYKAVEVMRLLQKAGCDVSVAMTEHATRFIAPLTFRALTERHVIVDDYDPENPDPIAHINFSQNIDLLLIVPATANVIAKFANGIADDFLTSTYLASTAPVLIAPAMNTTMWENAATQRNLKLLRDSGVNFVEPIAGELACKTVGTGKLEDVENITAQALNLLRNAREGTQNQAEIIDFESALRESEAGIATPRAGNPDQHSQDLAGESILITVGGTREPIDPVRFISNHSSGKMGFAVAEAAAKRGAEVTAIVGKVSIAPPENVKIVQALSAEEMHKAVMNELAGKTIFIGAAAVADYRPKNTATDKIKKDAAGEFSLELVKTPDILADVSANRNDDMLVIGFAAETQDLVEFAKAKLEKKNLDMVIANDIGITGAGFDSDTNTATVIGKKGILDEIPMMTKAEMADKILNEILKVKKDRQ